MTLETKGKSYPKGYHDALEEVEMWSRYAEMTAEALRESLQRWKKKAPLSENDAASLEVAAAALRRVQEDSALLRHRARKLHGR